MNGPAPWAMTVAWPWLDTATRKGWTQQPHQTPDQAETSQDQGACARAEAAGKNRGLGCVWWESSLSQGPAQQWSTSHVILAGSVRDPPAGAEQPLLRGDRLYPGKQQCSLPQSDCPTQWCYCCCSNVLMPSSWRLPVLTHTSPQACLLCGLRVAIFA